MAAASKKKTPAKSAKKPAAKKASAPAKKKPAAPKKPVANKKPAAPKAPAKKAAAVKVPARPKGRATKAPLVGMRDLLAFGQPVDKSRRLNPWLKKQQLRLLALKDTLLDSMTGVARDNLRTGHDSHEVSAHGLHQADAGSDAYDRDFALSLLSQERDSLFEIDAALKKINDGNYGFCEISGKAIPHNRLEALPFARYTVECQADLEKTNRLTRVRQPVTSLFGLGEEGETESEEEDTTTETKD